MVLEELARVAVLGWETGHGGAPRCGLRRLRNEVVRDLAAREEVYFDPVVVPVHCGREDNMLVNAC